MQARLPENVCLLLHVHLISDGAAVINELDSLIASTSSSNVFQLIITGLFAFFFFSEIVI